MSPSRRPVAIVGAGSLEGREILEGLAARGWEKEEIVALGEKLGGWELDVEDEGAEVFLPLQEEYLAPCEAVFLCARDPGAGDFVRAWAASNDVALFDLTCPPGSPGGLWNPSRSEEPAQARGGPLAFPEPESFFLATLLGGLAPEQVARLDCFLLQPSSIRGEPGVRELLRQSTDLLNFRPVSTEAFGLRLAFSLVPGGGGTEDSPFGRQVGDLLGWTPAFTWTAVEVPVFHGTVLSCHLEVADALEAEQVIGTSAAASGTIDRFSGDAWQGRADGSVPERPLLGMRPLSDRVLWIWLWFDQVKSGKAWMALQAFAEAGPAAERER